MKLWQKGVPLNKQIEAFTVDNDYLLDQQLLTYDCTASIAHARMLGKTGILTATEVEALVDELNNIKTLAAEGNFTIKQEDEDCHTAIENHLTQNLGETGQKIHTGRSRNDQVLTALRLFYKDALDACDEEIDTLQQAMRSFATKYKTVAFPGWTHTRKAMPSSINLWVNSIIDAMEDNKLLLKTALQLVDQSPLGTGAGYGVPMQLDREFTAKDLQFSKIQANPIYAQNSRGKFEATILHTLSQIMFDLNKMATDLIFFSLPEYGFIELPDEFCTGSSIMPQKKNPDVLELLRAKYHNVVAKEFQLKSLTSNLISGYHRDLQLTKEPVFTSFQMTLSSLSITTLIFKNLTVNEINCKNGLTEELFATQNVYKRVQNGVPFREAYRQVAKKIHKK